MTGLSNLAWGQGCCWELKPEAAASDTRLCHHRTRLWQRTRLCARAGVQEMGRDSTGRTGESGPNPGSCSLVQWALNQLCQADPGG